MGNYKIDEFKNDNVTCMKDYSIFSKVNNRGEISNNLIALKTANISIYICFYLKILNVKKRKEFQKLLENKMQFNFLEYPYKIEEEFSNKLKLDNGIAKNRALLDNLLSIFVCLNKKIPILLCGKSGLSKTLSLSLLSQEIKGIYSRNEFFKKYPGLFIIPYKGSLLSKPFEIKNIFKKAKELNEKQKNSKNKNLIVILIDKIDLIEKSPYNPLKLIISELEENQELGFIGISNQPLELLKLEQLKINIILVQEPELQDLIMTAMAISNDINKKLDNNSDYKLLIKNLSKSYFDYKNYMEKNCLINYDFHGIIDFYNLIKIIARKIENKEKEKSLEKITIESIERNFGGLDLKQKEGKIMTSINKFKEIFYFNQNILFKNINNKNKYDILSCIKNNLEDENGRHLILINNNSKIETLIELILKSLKKNYRFILGSKLEKDKNNEYYLEKTMNIISHMKNDQIIILKNLENIYSRFDELFNKNFYQIENSEYTRIFIDSSTFERHIVNKNFRCIILLEKNEIDKFNKSFLNRFEKHLISFESLLSEKLNILANEIYLKIKQISINNNNSFLINIDIEEIRCLLLNLSLKYNDIENHLIEIYELIIPTFTRENVLNSYFDKDKKINKNFNLSKIYEKNNYLNIYKYLELITRNKLMVYTFSLFENQIFSENNLKIINNNFFGIISNNTIFEYKFNRQLSEDLLKNNIILFNENKNNNLFIIRFRLIDVTYLNYVKRLINEFVDINKDNAKKIILFIIHLENCDSKNKNAISSKKLIEDYYSYFFSFISEYHQITIDNLFSNDFTK